MSALRELIEEHEAEARAEHAAAHGVPGVEPGDDGYGDRSRTDMMIALAAVQRQEMGR